jgi:hypothetical protein
MRELVCGMFITVSCTVISDLKNKIDYADGSRGRLYKDIMKIIKANL